MTEPRTEALKAMLRGQIPDSSPRIKWRVDDPSSSYDPLLRFSAVCEVIDSWAEAAAPLDVEQDAVDAALFRAASNVTTLCLNHGIRPTEFVAAIEAATSKARSIR